jgi:ketosteroid isomerase-like protein
MPERSGQQFAEAWVAMLNGSDFDRLAEFVQPDCVHEYPQSGERFRGIENIRGVLENYPGGFQRGARDESTLRVSGDDKPWVMAPNFTLIRTTGGSGAYTSAVKALYPDGSEWFVITLFELRDGRMARATLYFGQVFEAPEWRRPYAERGDTT